MRSLSKCTNLFGFVGKKETKVANRFKMFCSVFVRNILRKYSTDRTLHTLANHSPLASTATRVNEQQVLLPPFNSGHFLQTEQSCWGWKHCDILCFHYNIHATVFLLETVWWGDGEPNIPPRAALVPCHYKSHVPSECVTLQRESLHPTPRCPTPIYSLRELPPHLGCDPKTRCRIIRHHPSICKLYSLPKNLLLLRLLSLPPSLPLSPGLWL